MSVIQSLDPLHYRAAIATLSPEPADSLMGEFRALGIPVMQMGLSRMGSLLSGVPTLRRVVSQVNPDLVHAHGLRANILAAAAGLEWPIVSTVHSDIYQDYRFAYGRLTGTLAATLEYGALKRFHGVNAVSEPLAKVLRRSGVAARGILNGIEIGEFYPAPDLHSVMALRSKLGWPSDAVVVLHTGVLRNLKNPIEVVAGFRSSALSRSAYLAFAGDGPQRAECEKAAQLASNIAFLGKRSDIADLLRASDILISASCSEGLGTALLEGCASGIRVLATDIPAHRHIQEIFPDQVQIFGHGKRDSIRAALDSVAPQLWRQKFQPPRSALETISNRTMSAKYQEFYSDILQSAGGAVSGGAEVVLCP
jgi:glycosyltransferase involved in cell wall biosynthesis